MIVLNELNKIESLLELNNNLPEFNITCSPTNLSVDVGGEKYELYFLLATLIGIAWVEVKYMLDLSVLISSTWGTHGSVSS